MSPQLTFTCYGVPIPKGSAKGFVIRPKGGGPPRAVVTHDNPKTKPWQESVVAAARDAIAGAPPIAEPVELVLVFFLPRPKSAPRRIVRPAKRPDLDKLIRAVKDGLTRAGVYQDDGQVVALSAAKAFAAGAEDPERAAGVPRAWVKVNVKEA